MTISRRLPQLPSTGPMRLLSRMSNDASTVGSEADRGQSAAPRTPAAGANDGSQSPSEPLWFRLANLGVAMLPIILVWSVVYAWKGSGDEVWTGNRVAVESAPRSSLGRHWQGTVTKTTGASPLVDIHADDAPVEKPEELGDAYDFVPRIVATVSGDIVQHPEGHLLDSTLQVRLKYPVSRTYWGNVREETIDVEVPLRLMPHEPLLGATVHAALLFVEAHWWYAFGALWVLLEIWRQACGYVRGLSTFSRIIIYLNESKLRREMQAEHGIFDDRDAVNRTVLVAELVGVAVLSAWASNASMGSNHWRSGFAALGGAALMVPFIGLLPRFERTRWRFKSPVRVLASPTLLTGWTPPEAPAPNLAAAAWATSRAELGAKLDALAATPDRDRDLIESDMDLLGTIAEDLPPTQKRAVVAELIATKMLEKLPDLEQLFAEAAPADLKAIGDLLSDTPFGELKPSGLNLAPVFQKYTDAFQELTRGVLPAHWNDLSLSRRVLSQYLVEMAEPCPFDDEARASRLPVELARDLRWCAVGSGRERPAPGESFNARLSTFAISIIILSLAALFALFDALGQIGNREFAWKLIGGLVGFAGLVALLQRTQRRVALRRWRLSYTAVMLDEFAVAWPQGRPPLLRAPGAYSRFFADCESAGLVCGPADRGRFPKLRLAVQRWWGSPANPRHRAAFISHSHTQADFAQRLSDELKRREVVVSLDAWELDRNAIDGEVDRWIMEAMLSVEVAIFVVSREALASAWVERELTWLFRLTAIGQTAIFPYLITMNDVTLELGTYPAARIIRAADLSGDRSSALLDELATRIAADAYVRSSHFVVNRD